MGIISWIIVGLIAGVIAKFIMGEDYGFFMTILLGIVGGLIGGFIANLLGWSSDVTGINLPSIALAVLGAIVLLFVAGLFGKR